MSDIKRITPGSKADLASRMADRRRELIARPLAEIWEELAAVAMDGSDPAPQAPASVDPDLIERCKELIEWGKTGLLHGGEGGALRKLADAWEPKVGEHHAIRVAEKETHDEAMKALVQFAAPPVRSAAIAAEPVAEVLWYEPSPHEVAKPGKMIDASLAFMDSAPIGTKLYAAPTTSPEPDAVREIATTLVLWVEALRTPTVAEFTISEIARYNNGRCLTEDLELAIAALSRPEHGGWEIVQKMMKAWEGGQDGDDVFATYGKELAAAIARNQGQGGGPRS